MVTQVNDTPQIQGVSPEAVNQAVSSNTTERSSVIQLIKEAVTQNRKDVADIKAAYLTPPQNPYERGSAEVRAQLETRLQSFAGYIKGAEGLCWGRSQPHDKQSDLIAKQYILKFQNFIPTASDAEMRQAIASIDQLQSTLHNSAGRGRNPSDPAEGWTAGDDGVGMNMYASQIEEGLAAALQPLQQGQASVNWQARQNTSQDQKYASLLNLISQSTTSDLGYLEQLTQMPSLSTGSTQNSAFDDQEESLRRLRQQAVSQPQFEPICFAPSSLPFQVAVQVHFA